MNHGIEKLGLIPVDHSWSRVRRHRRRKCSQYFGHRFPDASLPRAVGRWSQRGV
ncbi:hypothetical protein Mapa_000070 [Marchantia paleacea]|nr:hypothetical protein Mapa_000070 [Marchantia paleacea]